MIKVIKTTAKHFEQIVLQKEQAQEQVVCEGVTDDMFTIANEKDEVMAIFRTIEFWKGRICVRAYISAKSGKYLFAIVKLLKRLYKQFLPQRLECEVLENFEAGKRFAKLFGMKQEAILHNYYKGRNYNLFVRLL